MPFFFCEGEGVGWIGSRSKWLWIEKWIKLAEQKKKLWVSNGNTHEHLLLLHARRNPRIVEGFFLRFFDLFDAVASKMTIFPRFFSLLPNTLKYNKFYKYRLCIAITCQNLYQEWGGGVKNSLFCCWSIDWWLKCVCMCSVGIAATAAAAKVLWNVLFLFWLVICLVVVLG